MPPSAASALSKVAVAVHLAILSFKNKTMESAMKKNVLLGLVLMTILASLAGCHWPGPWHHMNGHDRQDRYDNNRDWRQHERR